jgi:hypothetical protein
MRKNGMSRDSKGRRRRHKKSKKKALVTRSNGATAKQTRFIEHLREQFDPLTSGSEMPTSKEGAGAEIARLLNLKRKYEAMTRAPGDAKPKAAGQHRYPSLNAEVSKDGA